LDKKHEVTVVVEKFRLSLMRFDYLLIMKILMNNVLYDDGMDYLFNYNYNP
jgi:hypothetical protein